MWVWGLVHGPSCTRWNSNLKFKTCSRQADKQQIHNLTFLSHTITHITPLLTHKSWCHEVSTGLLFHLAFDVSCCLTICHIPLCSNLPEFMWRRFLLQAQHVHLSQRPDSPILWIEVRSFSISPFPPWHTVNSFEAYYHQLDGFYYVVCIYGLINWCLANR